MISAELTLKAPLKRCNAGGGSAVVTLKAQIDKNWGKCVWTQPRLKHFLSLLCELPTPLARRVNQMVKNSVNPAVACEWCARYEMTT